LKHFLKTVVTFEYSVFLRQGMRPQLKAARSSSKKKKKKKKKMEEEEETPPLTTTTSLYVFEIVLSSVRMGRCRFWLYVNELYTRGGRHQNRLSRLRFISIFAQLSALIWKGYSGESFPAVLSFSALYPMYVGQ
jgi:hypothetical protein